MTADTAIGLGLAAVSTTLINLAYLREHDAATKLPPLELRRPLYSARLLLADRNWLLGFGMESSGFLLYAAALALASLALVQSISAGGIGALAFLSARVAGRRLSRLELTGVLVSVVGLVALAVSLQTASGEGHGGSIGPILLWLGLTAAVAIAMLGGGRRGHPVADGVAAGLFFSIGDISTKLATQGGVRIGFVVTLIAGYLLGTTLMQIGYQSGSALTVAGIATLLTNALPIAAGPVVLGEPVPHGFLGGLRVSAFVAVTAGAALLTRPNR